MNPRTVQRHLVRDLTDLPNIGKASAGDLQLIGVDTPQALIGLCPYAMYDLLCAVTGARHDPCVIDVFISITRFMAGDEPQPWWAYTAQRKAACAGVTPPT